MIFFVLFSVNDYLNLVFQKLPLKEEIGNADVFMYLMKHSKIFNKQIRLGIHLSSSGKSSMILLSYLITERQSIVCRIMT